MSHGEIVVNGAGRLPNKVMLVGEAPGREEAYRGQPFVGKSGQLQESLLARHGLSARHWYRTNVVKLYIDGNPDPTPALVREWTPVLRAEVKECRPRIIVAVGRFAARWFLGDGVDMEAVHGIPHRPGAFDASRASRAGSATVVLPVYHPAYGLHDPDKRAFVAHDYYQVAQLVKTVSSGHTDNIRFPVDEHAGREEYLDVGGRELEFVLDGASVLALDTEGTPEDPWSIQVSVWPGHGMVLRRSCHDFGRGIGALRRAVDQGTVFAVHNAMYDLEVCRALGLELRGARLWDTMYASFLLRLEPQGLKPLAYRRLGMAMSTYAETVGDAGRDKQIDYLGRVMSRKWPKPEPRLVESNDGSTRVYTPQSAARRAESIALDALTDDDVDIADRWAKIDDDLRAAVEQQLGPMPVGTLADVERHVAVRYAARDADATLRLYYVLGADLDVKKLGGLMRSGMRVLPVFEEMQYHGLPASRRHFERLADDMDREMFRLRKRISKLYFGGRPFNPASHVQVATLLRRQGVSATKLTSTGVASTGKKSIEYLRKVNDAVRSVIEWREHQKIRDAFCAPILARMPEDVDIANVRCRIKVTRVHTRRLAASNPNFLAMPVRNEIGKGVREGFVCPPGQVFGAWDLSQIEMRYMAHASQDPLLCKRFRDGADIHRETAAEIFGVKAEDVDEMKHRYPAKRAAFGIIYGISGSGLFTQLQMMGAGDWSVKKCDKLISEWLRIYKGVADYSKRVPVEVARAGGVVRDAWGMIRYLPGILSTDPGERAEAGRVAVSHTIQGGAQGMIQNSMAWLDNHVVMLREAGEQIHWVLQIHDEIILQFDEGLWETVNALAVEALTKRHGVAGMRVPVKASGNVSTTWAGLK